MKKSSTVATKSKRNFDQKLTIGLDLGDRSSWYCVLNEAGEAVSEQKLGTTPKAMKEVFATMPRSRIALETGMHSPWVSRLLSELGHEGIVAHARNVRLIGESRRKDDRFDAMTLARLARNRPAVAVSGEASQRPGAGRPDGIMLVTPERNRRNRDQAFALAGGTAAVSLVAGWFFHPALLTLGLSPFIYWLVRRRCVRRLEVMGQPFPDSWEKVLQSHVAFFRSLPDPGKERFRQLVKVFLDEVRVTGIETEVDDTVRVLVAASAAIPIFGFDDWEYHRLGEVLVYPRSFGEDYQTTGGPDENVGGMVGIGQLRGVVILSKPWLFDGFDNPSARDNVGVHEFAHLVEREVAESGIPREVPLQVSLVIWTLFYPD